MSVHCVCVCRFWQEKTGMPWCIMGLSLRAASRLGCSPRFTLSFLLSLETVSSSARANLLLRQIQVLYMRSILGWITNTASMWDTSLTWSEPDTLLNVFLAIAVDNLANAQELTKVGGGSIVPASLFLILSFMVWDLLLINVCSAAEL